MDVGHDGDGNLGQNFFESCRVFFFRDSDPNQVRSGGGKLLDFGDAGINFVRLARRHRLHRDWRIPPDGHPADAIIAEGYFSRFPAENHSISPKSQPRSRHFQSDRKDRQGADQIMLAPSAITERDDEGSSRDATRVDGW